MIYITINLTQRHKFHLGTENIIFFAEMQSIFTNNSTEPAVPSRDKSSLV